VPRRRASASKEGEALALVGERVVGSCCWALAAKGNSARVWDSEHTRGPARVGRRGKKRTGITAALAHGGFIQLAGSPALEGERKEECVSGVVCYLPRWGESETRNIPGWKGNLLWFQGGGADGCLVPFWFPSHAPPGGRSQQFLSRPQGISCFACLSVVPVHAPAHPGPFCRFSRLKPEGCISVLARCLLIFCFAESLRFTHNPPMHMPRKPQKRPPASRGSILFWSFLW